MKHRYVYDLKDPASSWTGSSKSYFANGEVSSECGAVVGPEGPHGLYWMLDTVMKQVPADTDIDKVHMPHYHVKGYETFFVDSGKLYLYINGQKALCQAGDIVHLQAGQAHGFGFIEEVKWRGTYHDYIVDPDVMNVAKVSSMMPEAADDPELKALNPGMDNIKLEPFAFKEVAPEECLAIKHPDRPHAEYKFEGVDFKIIIERWENGGVKEMCCAKMQPGFTAEWDKYPKLRELFYVRKGKVKFKVMNDEFIADDECVVDIPKFAPHSIEVLEETEMYDLGGQTYWSLFMQNYESIKNNDPERFAKPETLEDLKKKFNMPIKSIGMKK